MACVEPDNKMHGNNTNVEIDENGDRKTRHIYIYYSTKRRRELIVLYQIDEIIVNWSIDCDIEYAVPF